MSVMSRDGAITFSDLIGKLDILRVSCAKCQRDGCYGLSRLIDKRGRDGKVIDWLGELTADCPTKKARDMNDPCAARCQDLARVL
jgi:hypothetical protein